MDLALRLHGQPLGAFEPYLESSVGAARFGMFTEDGAGHELSGGAGGPRLRAAAGAEVSGASDLRLGFAVGYTRRFLQRDAHPYDWSVAADGLADSWWLSVRASLQFGSIL